MKKNIFLVLHRKRLGFPLRCIFLKRGTLRKQAMTTISIDGNLLAIVFVKQFTQCCVFLTYCACIIFTFYIFRIVSVLLNGMQFQPNGLSQVCATVSWFGVLLPPHHSGTGADVSHLPSSPPLETHPQPRKLKSPRGQTNGT